ncbi:S24 family peptidase [Lentilactobacillus parabuchneri]|uniref:S24 family peptidase n=1 Tax=Lentilactobacillus parabuchneri TaxID=152331 RepID=UPI002307F134|nr:S24 family peptidase [Lentilactobacillus parabuchneri]MDB1104784.1 S24 family peptidase [Lentilactobacillus parabuchneri]
MSNAFGNYLRQLRGRHSLREIDQETENLGNRISFTALANYERGTSSKGNPIKPTPKQLNVLAKVYHVSYSDLMVRAGYIPVPKNVQVHPTSDGASITADVGWKTSNKPLDVYGEITAGLPTFADEHIIGQTIIPDDLIDKYGRDNLFALQVDGDSMSKVIAPGFIAVFAKDCEVENGDICAVLVDGENATLKRFKETSRAVILEPESFNPIYKPLIFPKNIDQDFRILGKYVFATSLLK